jgi:hypothetical protein
MYEPPIHPKNLWLEQDPVQHELVDEVYRENIERLVKRGSYTRPARAFPGVRYQQPSSDPSEVEWNNVRGLWAEDGD